MAGYPAHYESDVILRDGSTLRLRPVRPEDSAALRDLHERLSAESWRFRFFNARGVTLPDLWRLGGGDDRRELVLVAEAGGRVSGVASYLRNPAAPDRAEVAFTVADALQGRGVGTRLLEALARIAREQHIRTFDAYVLQDNHQMVRVFQDSGFEVEQRVEGGVVHVVLSLEPTAGYETRAAERSRSAAATSIRHFFEPAAVAVIGANRERGKIGSEILHNLTATGYTGRLFAVHPAATLIDGVPAFPRVTGIPGDIDLAVICVPCAQVSAVVDDCIAKGVRALVVISAGFSETGAAGRALEEALLDKVRTAGIRMIGPNCMGILNTDPAVRLNATFSPVAPVEGRVAFSTQSGALGLAILDYVRQLGIGISSFVSVGNKADVSGNDLLQYWADDPRTDVILLYLESFGNPRRFASIARRVARQKPIVAVKSGRSRAGARAASSHTGALAASDTVVDALFRQAGVIRTTRMEELFDVARLLALQPVPGGRRVAIVSNVGGPAILATDACEAQGLVLSVPADATAAALRQFLPAAASVSNPVDMLAAATADDYRRAVRILLADDDVDSLLAIFVPPLVTSSEDAGRAIAEAAAGSPKPVLANFITARGAPPELAGIPSYTFPEAAVAALARVTAYGEWRRRPEGAVPHFADVKPDVARGVVDRALARGEGWLTADEGQRLLEAAGIPAAAAQLAATEQEAIAAAQAIGYPVALKAAGAEILHKTEVGGIVLDVRDDAALRTAFRALASRVGPAMTAAIVQQMVPGGVELLVGAVIDPTFGPLVACGAGGVLAELLKDTVFRIHPLTDADAAEMVDSLAGVALLRGYRGHPPADEPAVVDALLRVSALLTICPEIHELDINPLKVLARGARAIDVRVRVGPIVTPAPRRGIAG